MGLGPGKRGPAGGRSGEGDEWDAGQEDGPQGTAGAGGGDREEGLLLPGGRRPPVHHSEKILHQPLPPVEVTELLRYGPTEGGIGEVFQGVNILP